MIDPSQAAFGKPVTHGPAGRLPEQGAGEGPFSAFKTVVGRRHRQHHRVEAAVHQEIGAVQ